MFPLIEKDPDLKSTKLAKILCNDYWKISEKIHNLVDLFLWDKDTLQTKERSRQKAMPHP